MGSGSSKPVDAPAQQVWKSDTPVRFSPELMNSLQSSPETDSTRAKTLELHIQSRVESELKKLQERAGKDFEELQAKISAQQEPEKGKSAGDTLRDLGRESVQNDVKELKKKLEQRRKLADVDESVEKAKSDVVKCLRENDRRPLDCWKEVQTFKDEVRRLEEVWVEKVVR
ncbi:putative altered inheritance of mitochondria protein 13, mitochondrial [Venustampulla echinocandica]|uniref:Putative altered inheritance of mitochondria protein 13, mitochondrial n=1 Tax=Venustampulla echinocandica TaxID=2656787 RepID=A0A370TZY4_9HELO|nr:putative altered inheritance of mitochondria protein 13, mitochondrial [Venustampulla echinocandica]RDL41089.1 putative altered inheritance of mitochondria protein 13, mitochondrial [Venustampulla echinocandica]